jgi:hypothetical protein
VIQLQLVVVQLQPHETPPQALTECLHGRLDVAPSVFQVKAGSGLVHQQAAAEHLAKLGLECVNLRVVWVGGGRRAVQVWCSC